MDMILWTIGNRTEDVTKSMLCLENICVLNTQNVKMELICATNWPVLSQKFQREKSNEGRKKLEKNFLCDKKSIKQLQLSIKPFTFSSILAPKTEDNIKSENVFLIWIYIWKLGR